jgi:hypothetical protein
MRLTYDQNLSEFYAAHPDLQPNKGAKRKQAEASSGHEKVVQIDCFSWIILTNND